MATQSKDSFQTLSTVSANGKTYHYYSLPKLAKQAGVDFKRIPYSIRVLIENLLRYEDGEVVTKEDVLALCNWKKSAADQREIQFMPSRVLLQDFTGVPALVDLAAMRGAMKRMGKNPKVINPLSPVDLVIDHSVQVDAYAGPDSLAKNTELEFERNGERYKFLKWAKNSFENLQIVPPVTGICHQVNLEYLAQVAGAREQNGKWFVFPDTVIGTDSHTPMVNGLGVVGWGVGGIEAEAAMLGQPCSMVVPEVIGFKLTGKMNEGITATDLILTVTQILRKKGVVGKFVEFFGPGTPTLTVSDRATLGNMGPEYGATIGISPVDAKTLEYLRLTGRDEAAERVEAYFKAQEMFADAQTVEAEYSDVVSLDLSSVKPSVAGPSRPQDMVLLSAASKSYQSVIKNPAADKKASPDLYNGSIVIAAITSCTNTSNPSVMIGAGILAKKAAALGLKAKPWVKTSLAPGSRVVTKYLENAGLKKALDEVGFNTVGYGCTTCIGNSGPLPEKIEATIKEKDLAVVSVLSGNRNFEARVHAAVRANYLMSPPLVVAYSLVGDFNVDITTEPLATGKDGKPVYLKDIWPTSQEIEQAMSIGVRRQDYVENYGKVEEGTTEWKALQAPGSDLFAWDEASTYIAEPPYFEGMQIKPTDLKNIQGARVLVSVGDSITTDHISPAGSIGPKSPAGRYLQGRGIQPADFNQYGARRGHHEVMIRGTFANVRIKNKLLAGKEGPQTICFLTGEEMAISDAAEKYRAAGIPLLVLAGKEYGTGSSRDWAAKGPYLQGVKFVIAESFERIHRSNLIGMGILPLQFKAGQSAETLGLTGKETFNVNGVNEVSPRKMMTVEVKKEDGTTLKVEAMCRIDTPNEVHYFKNGGILQYVLRQIANANS